MTIVNCHSHNTVGWSSRYAGIEKAYTVERHIEAAILLECCETVLHVLAVRSCTSKVRTGNHMIRVLG